MKNKKDWYYVKEKSAGEVRLMLSYFVYKIFGKIALNIIAFFVSFFTFVFSSDVRMFSKNNLKVIYEYSNKKTPKPNFINSYKNVLNYALSLADKIEAFRGKLSAEEFEFEDIKEKEIFFNDIKENKGIFLITSHIGNSEILRSFVSNPDSGFKSPKVNVFMKKDQCRIFNSFLNKIKLKTSDIEIFDTDDISVDDAINIDEKMNKGEIVIMAGDRISNEQKKSKIIFLNKEIYLPSGVFEFARILDKTTYFISAVKKRGKYKIYLKKLIQLESLDKKRKIEFMQKEYLSFLEKLILIAPEQFYHFYDFFN